MTPWRSETAPDSLARELWIIWVFLQAYWKPVDPVKRQSDFDAARLFSLRGSADSPTLRSGPSFTPRHRRVRGIELGL